MLDSDCVFDPSPHLPGISAYLARMVGSQDAADLAQETAARAIAAHPDFLGLASIKNWMYRIAHNLAMDHIRKSGRPRGKPVVFSEMEDGRAFADIIDDRPWSAPGTELERREMSECIASFVDALQPNFKSIIILREFDHFDCEEIADILKLSPENVRVRLHRARTALRKALAEGCHIYRARNGGISCDLP